MDDNYKGAVLKLRDVLFPGGHPESSTDYFDPPWGSGKPLPGVFNGWASVVPFRRTERGIEAADLFELLTQEGGAGPSCSTYVGPWES
jgi:hypothetical protein